MSENKPFLSAPQKTEELTFTKIPIPQTKNVHEVRLSESSIHHIAVIKTENFFIALSSDIPDILLVKIL